MLFATVKQEDVPLHIDNLSAIKLTKNPEFHSRTKHIAIKHHFIRGAITDGHIRPEWISGKENPANILTKPLQRILFSKHRDNLGMQSSATHRSAVATAPAL